jgi:hypothetical protein
MRGRITAVVSVSLLLGSLSVSGNPARSSAGGHSLGEWMARYTAWSLGGDQPGQEKSTVFLPLPPEEPDPTDPTIVVGTMDLSLRQGQRFALLLFGVYGESYLEPGVPDDDPADYPVDIFNDARVLLTLDGKSIIDSTTGDPSDFFFDTEFFDEAVVYDEPVEHAPDLHSVAALWVKGLGFVHAPLSKGHHTLTLFVYTEDFGFGYSDTWNITVGK